MKINTSIKHRVSTGESYGGGGLLLAKERISKDFSLAKVELEGLLSSQDGLAYVYGEQSYTPPTVSVAACRANRTYHYKA